MIVLGRFKQVELSAYLRPSISKDGIDTGADLDLHADPPHSPGQCFAAVGNQVVANHSTPVFKLPTHLDNGAFKSSSLTDGHSLFQLHPIPMEVGHCSGLDIPAAGGVCGHLQFIKKLVHCQNLF
jgi:hypothetical protein